MMLMFEKKARARSKAVVFTLDSVVAVLVAATILSAIAFVSLNKTSPALVAYPVQETAGDILTAMEKTRLLDDISSQDDFEVNQSLYNFVKSILPPNMGANLSVELYASTDGPQCPFYCSNVGQTSEFCTCRFFTGVIGGDPSVPRATVRRIFTPVGLDPFLEYNESTFGIAEITVWLK